MPVQLNQMTTSVIDYENKAETINNCGKPGDLSRVRPLHSSWSLST